MTSAATITGAVIIPGFMDRIEYTSYRRLADALADHGIEPTFIDLFGGVQIAKLGQYTRLMSHDIFSLRAMADDALAHDDRQCAVVGYCYGANLALQLAAVDPRISAVVAIAPTNFFIWADRFSEERAQTLPRRHFILPGLDGEPTAGPFTIPLSVLTDAHWHDVEVALPAIIQPALFVVGRNDDFIPPETVERLHGLCGSTRKDLSLIDGVEHDYRRSPEQVEAVSTTVAEWLTGLAESAPDRSEAPASR